LVELMITIALLAVVLAIATPSMRNFILDQRVRASFSDFQRGVNLARAEAIRRNQRVTFAAADCASFSSGWKVFIDSAAGADQCHNGGEALIMQGDPLHSALRVVWTNADGDKHYLLFTPTGAVALANGAVGASRLSLDVASTSAVRVRTLCINFYGRTRSLIDSTTCGGG
jgi:type IV fimbrial biogenesis protein FimT